MNGSEEKWEAFNIDCRPETETADIFIVAFNPKTDAGRSAPNKSSPASVTIENTAGNLVTLKVKKPENAMPGISAEDYSKKACVIVRQMLEQV